ncbi:MAG: putative 26S proteasome regulatory subunit [Candelina mexicana]|nr:MAG: putative 26S proteasome regulatory subunit [Candelina mexicana]
MGLRMDDIHAPTVSSGPRAGGQASATSRHDKKPLMELVAEKDRVESELRALSSVLDSHGVNMNTSLTTFDGYPRDDLDIAQIRTTRARIVHLRNDYKGLMSKIEAGLHEHHASAGPITPTETRADTAKVQSAAVDSNVDEGASYPGLVETPFAKVNSVVPGSPADDAGLKAGDRIRRFGSANWINHEKLSKVAEVVQRNEGRSILVKVVRMNSDNQSPEELQLQLTPRRNWGGRGMLGCHLLPA